MSAQTTGMLLFGEIEAPATARRMQYHYPNNNARRV
jgi:hypothetical protein